MIREVLRSLGVDVAPVPDLEGLRTVYAAWCAHVPFDNVRKMIWLRRYSRSPLPGGDAEHFFAGFLQHGTGGTCWPSANGLHHLLRELGFEARRITGSMRDMGVVNHGSVQVNVEGRHWLADSSMLTQVPVSLSDCLVCEDHPVFGIEIEPDNGTHIAWMQTPPNEFVMPCRLDSTEVTHEYFLHKYEESRERSPFNQRLYARRNRGEGMVVLLGNMRYRKTADGVVSRDLRADELCEALRDDIGLSEAIVREWVDSGSLLDSMQPNAGPAPPPVTAVPPSRR